MTQSVSIRYLGIKILPLVVSESPSLRSLIGGEYVRNVFFQLLTITGICVLAELRLILLKNTKASHIGVESYSPASRDASTYLDTRGRDSAPTPVTQR